MATPNVTATISLTSVIPGPGGQIKDSGFIITETDASVGTVMTPTTLTRIDDYTYGEVATTGTANTPVLAGTVAGGAIVVNNGSVKSIWDVTGTRVFSYTFYGN